jgi:hypothetical protein
MGVETETPDRRREMKVLGVNDEVTTCECCGRTGLKKTVVLGTDGGEVRYGTECAARAMKCDAAAVRGMIKTTADEFARQAQIAANAEWDAYQNWLIATYGDARSDMARRKAWRKAVAA